MKVSEDDRRALMLKMAKADKGLWIDVYSELQYEGDELPFWFLIHDASEIEAVFDVYMAVIRPYLENFADTKFFISFSERRGDKRIIWDTVDDDEIRSGKTLTPLSAHPMSVDLGDTSVFQSVQDYIDRSRKK